MKRWIKYLICFSVVCALILTGRVDCQAESYTYTVTVYTGNQGTVTNASGISVASHDRSKIHISVSEDCVTITGLSYGDNISCNAQKMVSVADDSAYYVKGIRLSARDNNTIAKNAAFTVVESQDYVIAYGIKGTMTEYTVKYVDEQGNELAESQSYYGNVGDEPVLAYLYIDGYIPETRNITRKLEADSSKNEFEFIYKPGQSQDSEEQNDDPEGINNENNNANAANPDNGNGGNNAGNNNADNGGNNGNPADNNGNNAGVNDAGVGDIDNAGGNDDQRQDEVNRPTDIEEDQVPRAANDKPGTSKKAESRVTKNGMLLPIIIGSVAAVILVTSGVLLFRQRRKKISISNMKHDEK